MQRPLSYSHWPRSCSGGPEQQYNLNKVKYNSRRWENKGIDKALCVGALSGICINLRKLSTAHRCRVHVCGKESQMTFICPFLQTCLSWSHTLAQLTQLCPKLAPIRGVIANISETLARSQGTPPRHISTTICNCASERHISVCFEESYRCLPSWPQHLALLGCVVVPSFSFQESLPVFCSPQNRL